MFVYSQGGTDKQGGSGNRVEQKLLRDPTPRFTA